MRGLFLYSHSLTPAPGDPGPSLFWTPLALHAHSADIFCRQNTHSYKIIKYKDNIMIFKVALADSKITNGKRVCKNNFTHKQDHSEIFFLKKKGMWIFSLLCIKQIHGTDPISKIRRHLMIEQHIALAAMTS